MNDSSLEQFGFYLQDAEAAWTGNANSAFGLQNVKWSDEQWQQCKLEYFTKKLGLKPRPSRTPFSL